MAVFSLKKNKTTVLAVDISLISPGYIGSIECRYGKKEVAM